jgi:hypothetical protein
MFKYFLRNNYFLNPEIVHFYDSGNKDIILSECNQDKKALRRKYFDRLVESFRVYN